MPDPSPAPNLRSNREAMRHGLLGRCPRCGQGKLFAGYLRVAETCSSCGEPLGLYRAADGPAFVTMSVVGLLLIPILGFGFALFRSDPLTLALVVTAGILIVTLLVLRLVKGAFIGHLWAEGALDRGG